jgi:glycosyltransferase involved in cell wall biosynthesis
VDVAPAAARHVGVDATCWMLGRGFGRHARCLLRALVEVDGRNRYTFFVDSPETVPLLPTGVDVRLVSAAAPTIVAASARGHRRLRDMAAMSQAISRARLDVVLFPTLYSYVPTFGRARRFVIVHDATAEMYPALTLGGWKNRLFWSAKASLGRRQADVLVTVSDYARDTIVARLGVPAGRLHVVGEAPDPVFRVLDRPEPTERLRALRFDASRRSIVYVGGFSPHKNLEALVRVADRLARSPEFTDLQIVFVGEHEDESFLSCAHRIRQLVGSLGLESLVTFTGYLPDDDLVVLLNNATVLVVPSLTEGFGLPAIEAAACGCPVVATIESPLPRILGEGGVYVDPRDDRALERAIAEVLRSSDLRRHMREAGVAAARRLSWHTAARRLIDLFENGAPS